MPEKLSAYLPYSSEDKVEIQSKHQKSKSK
jgi:hypothetical protein